MFLRREYLKSPAHLPTSPAHSVQNLEANRYNLRVRDFRWDRVRGFCSILAEERGARPLDFSGESGPCPFCPGNEGMTPPEIMRVGEPWRVRVFPNKYPATDLHEVIVDSPRHGVSLSELSDDDLALAVDTWRKRVSAAYSNPSVKYVSLFHNHGPTAGASRRHIHTQLVGLPFLPPVIEREIGGEVAKSSLRDGHIFHEEDGLVALCPEVSRFPYETWIMPREPQGLLPDGPMSLAGVLKRVLKALEDVLSSPDYNLILKSMPGDWHWRVEIIPRTGFLAGFELDTGCHILSVSPAKAAYGLSQAIEKRSP